MITRLWPFLAAVATLSAAQAQIPAFGPAGGTYVRISNDGFPNSPKVSVVNWDQASSSNIIYCMGSADIQKLRFFCSTCTDQNNTDINQIISSHSSDQSTVAQYPLLKIANMKVDSRWNGHTLQCEGISNNMDIQGQQQKTAADTAKISVIYQNQPYIVNAEGRRPMFSPVTGNTLYLPCNRQQQRQTGQQGRQPTTTFGPCMGGSSITLRCIAEGNPKPTVVWKNAGGQQLGNQMTFTVQGTQVEQIGSISCESQVGRNTPITSQSVRLEHYDRPQYLRDNIEALQASPKFQGATRVRVGETFDMTCVAFGNPIPQMFWRRTREGDINRQQIYNISCPQGQASQEQVQGPTPTAPFYVVQSKCPVRVANYSSQGEYWCAPCIEIADGHWDCGEPDRNNTRPQKGVLPVDVIGEPMLLREQVVPNGRDANLELDFCSDPAPNQDQVRWYIDGTEVSIGDSYDNMQALPLQTLRGWNDCQSARLRISPVTNADESRRYELRVENSVSQATFGANLGDLMSGDGSYNRAGLSAWWIVLIVVLCLLVLLCCVCVFCCFVRRMFCFQGVGQKRPQRPANEPPKDKYLSNVAPSQLSSEPRPPGYATNGYNAQPEKYGGNTGYNYQQQPPPREGYNYAELDLAPDNRPFQPVSQPTDYAQLQQQRHSPAVLASTSVNSVV